MSSKEYPTCPFCRPDNTCLRHKEKNVPKVKTMKPIKKVSDKKKLLEQIEKADKKRLAVFYNEMLNVMPYDCMNCGKELFSSTIINSRTVVAHILPKSKFKSIDTNIDNVVFMCSDCHNSFDTKTERFMKEQPIAALIKERVALLLPKLTKEDSVKVPSYLLTNSLQ